ncbi:uncharacterized protein LOC103391988 isoform X2 [Cynoglossus semilaevis]|uniref:Uncharacterized LOC103391988 n=1 Tax=Cynoglossus semilaevis TaxID=244447 RepID=A0A3P8VFU5_CYNSE|nr:uncharacterized protein LOC103391988 isoform X2 [Cynoglossus semilaevis]
MVHTCVVAGCRNRRTPGTTLSFYRFPRDPERKQRWIAAVNREGWVPNDGSRLCSTHFISGKQVKNPRSPDYVPSVFTTAPLSPEMKESAASEVPDKQEARVEAANALLFLQGQGTSSAGVQDQEERPEEKEQEAAVEESASSLSTDEENEDSEDEPVRDSKKGKFSQVPVAQINFEDILRVLKKENQLLRESVEKMSLSENSLRNDAEKQLLLTLMRLRLDLRNQDLAYRFGVKASTVTRTVHRMVNIMSSTLVPTAVFWPSRAELRKNLPAALRASHPDCAVIIDCFTVPFEEPFAQGDQQKSVGQNAQGFGAGYNLLKYLIGVAPQGVVTFVSRGVQGNISDKSLAEGCGFLCKLLPGDVVLASHNLDIADSVAARGAVFQIAGGVQGAANGSSKDLLSTVCASETLGVQKHVETVISMVKRRYSMLTGPVEGSFTTAPERSSNLTTFDKIVQVACALNNLCISAAPLEKFPQKTPTS